MEERKIRISDLFAYLLKRLPAILLVAVLAAVVFFGVKKMSFVQEKDKEKIVPQQQFSSELLYFEEKYAAEQDYMNNSLLMKLNPYDTSETVVTLQISNVAESDGSKKGTREDLFLALEDAYLTRYNNSDIFSEEGASFANDVPSRYLEELVSVDTAAGGLITVRVIGESEEETESIANDVVELLVSFVPKVSSSVCEHSLETIGSHTERIIDKASEEIRENHLYNMSQLAGWISALGGDYSGEAAAEEKGPGVKEIVIGGFAGFFLAAAFLALKCVLNNRLYSSYSGEINLNIPFLGTVLKKPSGLKALAARLSGERLWESEESAENYLLERTKCILPEEGRVLLFSSLKDADLNGQLGEFAAALQKDGREVCISGNPAKDSAAFAELRPEDTVLLCERVDESRIFGVKEAISAVEIAGAAVKGFILV